MQLHCTGKSERKKERKNNAIKGTKITNIFSVIIEKNLKMFECSVCEKKFKTKGALKSHKIRHHRGTNNFKCAHCDLSFSLKSQLLRHLRNKIICPYCQHEFTTNFTLKRHLKNCNYRFTSNLSQLNAPQIHCHTCDKSIIKTYLNQHLRSYEHRNKLAKRISDKIDIYSSSFDGAYRIYRRKIRENSDSERSLVDSHNDFIDILEADLSKFKSLKFRIAFYGIYRKINNEKIETESDYLESLKTFYSKYHELFLASNINEVYEEAENELKHALDEFVANQSGWTLFLSLQTSIEILKTKHLRGGCYIPLEGFLKKHSNKLLNIKTTKSDCFLLSIIAYFFHSHVQYPDEAASYEPFRRDFNIGDLKFPLTLREIEKFERLNEDKQFSINVFSYSHPKTFMPIKISKRDQHREIKHIIDILLITDTKTDVDANKFHYLLIHDLEGLIKNTLTKDKHAKNFFLCRYCLAIFNNPNMFEFHNLIGCDSKMPVFKIKKPFISFDRYYAMQLQPILFVADFECILNPDVQNLNAAAANTKKINIHTPFLATYGIIALSNDDEFKNIRVISGRDCISGFIDSLIEDINLFYDKYLSVHHPPTEVNDSNSHIFEELLKTKKCYVSFMKKKKESI